MARISLVEAENATPEVKEIYEKTLRGKPGNAQKALSKRVGLTPEEWRTLKDGNYARFTEKERTALAYAEKLTRASRSIADADFEKLKQHFSDPEIVDLHLLVGLANLTNRFTDPLGLELEFPEENI
jgi:alkylhydroperoxidase family enzyme